jgi:sulfur-oxidizing protein SoxY
MQHVSKSGPTRRTILVGAAALASLPLVRPAHAEEETAEQAIRKFVGEATVKPGKVHLDVPPLVENGNSVPINVKVDSAMTAAEHVKRIAIFNEKNPQPNIAIFHLGPRAGRAAASTRCRLATSQTLTAIAELSDGTFWSDSAEVIVTLAACTEEL